MSKLRIFLSQNNNKVIVKPNAGGSSIGVCIADSFENVMLSIQEIFEKKIDDSIIIEEFCYGKEFTCIVVENHDGKPVAFVPSQIVVSCNYNKDAIFDYRKKYLPTANTRHISPPDLSIDIIHEIMDDAEKIFEIFKMRDFVRIDGWVLDDNRVIFSDINPISGMEQNSFLFKQPANIGMTHHQVLRYIVENARKRHGIICPDEINNHDDNKPVYVLFGGSTAERQVSVMSGVNVWLKLLQSEKYCPIPCFLDQNNDIWTLPYSYTLFLTVEEIYENCIASKRKREFFSRHGNEICQKLGIVDKDEKIPEHMQWQNFLTQIKNEDAFLFLALHGGDGEDGTIQSQLEELEIRHNGSNSTTSRLCIDKKDTIQQIQTNLDGVDLIEDTLVFLPKILCRIVDGTIVSNETNEYYSWDRIKEGLNCNEVIIKPATDGCSAGIAHLSCAKDLELYINYITSQCDYIPENTLSKQATIVELSKYSHETAFIIEKYINVDAIVLLDHQLKVDRKEGWIEMTVGILEEDGNYHSLNPSITVSEHSVLTLEEKFQGGTGVNLTPPPETLISGKQIELIRNVIVAVSKILNIRGYARIDIFFNYVTDKAIIIEVNNLPALTPSTVLFHQALAEEQPIYPLEFIERLIHT